MVGTEINCLQQLRTNTEINCMHVKKVFALRRRQKKLFSVGAACKKHLHLKMFYPSFPPPPRQKNLLKI